MSMNYFSLTEQRKDIIDGEGPWIWIKEDHGSWTGPQRDWTSSHKEKFLKYLTSRNVVVTAGANQGMYARFYARVFGTVYAFEPDPLNFFCLNNNCQTDNVIKVQAALGATNGLVSLYRPNRGNAGMNITKVTGNSRIPMFAIDQLPLPDLNFLQLDTEGAETFIIEGAKNTIAKYHPVIALENGDKLEDQMKKLGYEMVDKSCMDTIFTWKG